MYKYKTKLGFEKHNWSSLKSRKYENPPIQLWYMAVRTKQ